MSTKIAPLDDLTGPRIKLRAPLGGTDTYLKHASGCHRAHALDEASTRYGTATIVPSCDATARMHAPFPFDRVSVIRQTDVALLCRMGNQHRWIAPTQFQPGGTATA